MQNYPFNPPRTVPWASRASCSAVIRGRLIVILYLVSYVKGPINPTQKCQQSC
jgi:hypothetical protein